MDRAEVLKIATEVADSISDRYHSPKTVEYGLAESLGEERAASRYYRDRATHAENAEDFETAKLYDQIASEEDEHADHFNARIEEINKLEPPKGDSVAKREPRPEIEYRCLDSKTLMRKSVTVYERDIRGSVHLYMNSCDKPKSDWKWLQPDAYIYWSTLSAREKGYGENIANIMDTVVSSPYRRRGLGTLLVKQAVNSMQKYGIESIVGVDTSGTDFWGKQGLITNKETPVATFKIESADIGHKALVYGKEGIITGVTPRGEWYNLKMKDGTELKHEPKANVTVLADIAK